MKLKYEPLKTTRQERGMEIANAGNQIERINDLLYEVRAQSGYYFYQVVSTDIGWTCTCPDHQKRGVKCKHIWAVEISFSLRQQVKKNISPKNEVSYCPYCNSTAIKKNGVRKNKSGDIQRYICENCNKTFSFNIGFEKMKHNPQAITTAMQLYFSGESLRNTQQSLKFLGTEVSHQTIHNWIEKYTTIMKKYVDSLAPDVGNTWRADEVWVKFSGNMKYLFALIDDETRYWIAQEVADSKFRHDARALLKEGKKVAGKRPNVFITDGLAAYHDAFNKEFYTTTKPRSRHINAIKLNGDMNNNKMERLNGEFRDREKVMRGLKSTETPIISGYQIFHNFIRGHQALDGKTPAEACGITVEGDNKWITLIQNASQY